MIKAALAVAIFILGLLSVLAPQRLVATSSDTAQHWFSLGNMAASGVLLSAGLVHMLADSAEALDKTEFPLANFVAGLTFIGFMVLEESLHLMFMSVESDGSDPLGQAIMAGHDHGHGHGHERETTNHIEKNGHSSANHHPHNNSSHSHDHQHETTPLLLEKVRQADGLNKFDLPKPEHTDPPVPDPRPIKRVPSAPAAIQRRRSSGGTGCVGYQNPNTYRPSIIFQSNPQMELTDSLLPEEPSSPELRRRSTGMLSLSMTTSKESHHHHHHHHHKDHLDLHLHGSVVASGILMLALSIHSIMAGISIGILSSPETIASTALAILAHKAFEGFCLGSSLVSAHIASHHLVAYWSLCIAFALATPMGILMGYCMKEGLEQSKDHSKTVIGMVQAMVAGTFLYISIVEIGTKELLACRHEDAEHGSQWQKYLDVAKLICFVLGYLAMSGLALFV